jgi:hypothetical protein
VADPGDIERDLQQLATELRRLEGEYNMFFAGRLPRPPWETRRRVEAILRRYERTHFETAALRFRFGTLQARYATFTDLWDRGLRAREEGRPGPFGRSASSPAEERPHDRVVYVASFVEPLSEMDKLEDLYQALMDARRETGEAVVPFHKFAELVKDQVKRLRQTGSLEVAFRVTVKDGKVNLRAKGLKEVKE